MLEEAVEKFVCSYCGDEGGNMGAMFDASLEVEDLVVVNETS